MVDKHRGGVGRGKTEALFAPADNCLRAQVVTFLYRCAA